MKTAIILAVILGVTSAQNHQSRNFHSHPSFHNQPSTNRNSYDADRNSYQSEQYNDQQQQQQQRRQQEHQQPQQQSSNNFQDKRLTTTPIPIIQWNKQQEHDGTYRASYETGNNIIAEESGYIKTVGQGEDQTEALVQQGSYSFMTPDGQIITTHYTADENGFHVSGDHIPTPPPVSEEIQKGLDLIYAGIRQQQEEAAREAQLNPGKQVQQFEDDGRYRPQ